MDYNILQQRYSLNNDNICIHCSLCCDGSLFGKARVNECDDLNFLKQMGCELSAERGKYFFSLPCQGLKGSVCTLYHDKKRFKVCRDFRCKLLKRYLVKKISFDSAIGKIREVKLRRESVKELSKVLEMGTESGLLFFINTLKKCKKLDNPHFRKTYAVHILDCLILGELLYKDFYSKPFKQVPSSD